MEGWSSTSPNLGKLHDFLTFFYWFFYLIFVRTVFNTRMDLRYFKKKKINNSKKEPNHKYNWDKKNFINKKSKYFQHQDIRSIFFEIIKKGEVSLR